MGRLDEGGSRGQCAGLNSLLEDILSTISNAFGPVLRLAESMFNIGAKMDIDLVTEGVWVPIVTALMADAGIKMAIFSPGIASILQQNYLALDAFMGNFTERLLGDSSPPKATSPGSMESLYFQPKTSADTIQQAQERVFEHPKTAEFSKRWNLPIYYQLRFGDACNRLNAAVEKTRSGGWINEVFTGDKAQSEDMRCNIGFELSFFLELYDTLLFLWRPDVVLRPLTNRLLRGSVQLVGRSVAFIKDGMEGKILFGEDKKFEGAENGNSNTSTLSYPVKKSYCWADSPQDVASVAWELAILDTTMTHDFASIVCTALDSKDLSNEERSELHALVGEVLRETSQQIQPVIDSAWNDTIVTNFIDKCSAPLAAVKGVAATYRMTNRPPPSQASPFVGTILRPLKEFDQEFAHRTPDIVGNQWKTFVVSAVTERYSLAMEELIDTVKKTEVALQNRRATRKAVSGGISDGDKVKLQLFLDYQAYERHVQDLGVDVASIPGVEKLKTLTTEGCQIQAQNLS